MGGGLKFRKNIAKITLITLVIAVSSVNNVIGGDVPKQMFRRGLLQNLPATPMDAYVNLKKRHVEENSHEKFVQRMADILSFDEDHFPHKGNNRQKRNIFQLPELISSKNVSQECIKGFIVAIPALLDIFYGEIPFWPLNLIDSTGKSAIGSLRGTKRLRGNFHACLGIRAKTPRIIQNWINPVHYIGKFCHIKAEYGSGTVSNHMENEVIPSKPTRKMLDTEICFPSLCSDDDVLNIVEIFSNELVYDEFEVKYMKCSTSEKGPMSSWTVFVIVICSLWGTILLTGTAFDLIQEFIHNRKTYNWLDLSKPLTETVSKPPEHGLYARMLLSLSIPRNFGYLLDNPIEFSPEEYISAIGGLRFFTFLWMQIVTIYLVAIKLPWANYAGILEDLRTTNFQWIINGRFAAETTFCLSGFLASYVTLRSINRNGGHFTFYSYYIRRYSRILPAYLLVMLLATAFYWYSYDETPDWVGKYQFEDACKKHWWKGLLFINNFFRDTESCPPLSWYFAVDMQLHLMAPFVIYILYNKPRVGVWLIILSTVVFSSLSTLLISSQGLPFFIGRLFYFEDNYQGYLDYVLQMPFTHAGPFLIGMLFGYILYANGIKHQINKIVAMTYWLLSVTTVLVIIYGFYPYLDGTNKMSPVLGLLYNTLTPSLWALAIGWIIYACATGNGYVLNSMLSLNIFSNFNRFSYCSYLAQALAIKHFLMSRADPLYYEPWMMLLIVNGSTVMAVFAGIAISVAIERPILELIKATSYQTISKQNAKIVSDTSEDEETEVINGSV
ncbi:hypothetical protein CHUAL_002063 [Chamberlinius hualienensis]